MEDVVQACRTDIGLFKLIGTAVLNGVIPGAGNESDLA
jgi:hypothetical protein